MVMIRHQKGVNKQKMGSILWLRPPLMLGCHLDPGQLCIVGGFGPMGWACSLVRRMLLPAVDGPPISTDGQMDTAWPLRCCPVSHWHIHGLDDGI